MSNECGVTLVNTSHSSGDVSYISYHISISIYEGRELYGSVYLWNPS
jgi:hypothetical protein